MTNLASVITTPTYELILPSTGKKIEYRPFLVKEEKILMMASESKNEKEIYRAMQDVVSACTLGNLKIEEASMLDIEYLFLKIRSKSVGESVKPMIKCKKCEASNEIAIDISSIEPTFNEEHKNKVEIAKDVILEMRHPRFIDIERLQNIKSEAERMFTMIRSCIEKIYTPKGTFVTKDLDENEVTEFLGNLTQSQFASIGKFFETMPVLKKDIEYHCNKCKNVEQMTLKGAQDFF